MIESVKIIIDPITKKRLNPLHDFFFKKMFGEKGCEKLVSYLIEAILEDSPYDDDVDLENIVFLNPYVNADTVEKKGLIRDVLAKTDKFIINIESQIQKQAHFGERLIFYITKLFPKNLIKEKTIMN